MDEEVATTFIMQGQSAIRDHVVTELSKTANISLIFMSNMIVVFDDFFDELVGNVKTPISFVM